jgi:hypothetical protein
MHRHTKRLEHFEIFCSTRLIKNDANKQEFTGSIFLSKLSHEKTHLQFILMIGVSVGELAKFLCQAEAVVDVFWRHKVLSNLDAAVQISHLHTQYKTMFLQPQTHGN